MNLAGWVQSYGYIAVATGTFLEGESVLLVAGAAAAQGHLSLPVVVALAAFASFLGDQLFFLLGHRYGAALLARFPSLQPRSDQVTALLERHHVLLILSVRFMYGLRIVGPVAIGMAPVSWLRFLLLNGLAAALWAVLVGSIGYGTGQALLPMLKNFDADEIAVLVLLLVLGLAWWVIRHRRASRRDH